MTVSAKIKIHLSGGMVGVGDGQGTGVHIETSAAGKGNTPSGVPSVGNSWTYGKRYERDQDSCTAMGKCIATVELEDIPCWYNGYMLFAELRDVAAGMTGGHGDSGYDNSITFKTGSLNTYRGEGGAFYYMYEGQTPGVEAGWYRTQGFKMSQSMWGNMKSGTLTASGCVAEVWLRGVVGHGREVRLCPSKMTGSDRPSSQIVFAGEMGVSAKWSFAGNCSKQGWKYDSYDEQNWHGHGWESGSGWTVTPQPADDDITTDTVEFSFTAGRSWTTGLQTWQIGGVNQLHGHFSGDRKAYRQSGTYSVEFGGDDSLKEGRSQGDCEYEGGTGSVSGRTAYDDIDPDDSDQVIDYPILYYGGNASCRISTTTDDGSHNSEYHYPNDETVTPTAADALDAYDEYLEKVMECDVDVPAVADYRSDGEGLSTIFSGGSSEESRSEDIELTITIQEG